MRDGKTIVDLHHNYVCVGDILELKYGKEIPVDGIFLAGSDLTTNEAAMTGESDERRKEGYQACMDKREAK